MDWRKSVVYSITEMTKASDSVDAELLERTNSAVAKLSATMSALTESDEDDQEDVFADAAEDIRAVDDINSDLPLLDDHVGQHPALKKMCVVDCGTKKRIVPNSEPLVLDNDLFHGQVYLMVRTPDVDSKKSDTKLGEEPSRVSKYFKDKKRRFEFQFQLKLKRIPTGPLFLGCELEHPIKVGAITKGLVNLLLAMVRRINPGFHYSWGVDEKNINPADLDSGNYEVTHLSFPLEASMDRLVITKPGEIPPKLGSELFETNESVKRRRKTGFGCVPWNLEDTFTLCLWSQYCDWIKWKSMNVPGVSPFLMSRVTGQQPIYLCVYEVACSPAEYRKNRPGHLRKNLNISSRMEFSNSDHTIGGLVEKILPGRSKRKVVTSEHSIGETESVNSDFETKTHVTVN